MRIGCWVAGVALLAVSAPALAADKEKEQTGLIVANACGGHWARFACPVATGSIVRIRAYHDGLDLATARVEWASRIPPYEAFLVDMNPPRTRPTIKTTTGYQDFFMEGPVAGYVDKGDPIVAGFFVVARTAPVEQSGDALAITLAALSDRPEFRLFLSNQRIPPANAVNALRLVQRDRGVVWADPITTRLIGRALEILRDKGGVQESVLVQWFPVALATAKESEPRK